MKSLILISFVVYASFTSIYTENVKNSDKIIELIGESRYQFNLENNPGLIYFLDAKVDFGFQIIDMIPEKSNDFKQLSQIPLLSKSENQSITPEEFVNLYNSGNLNILLFDFQNQPKSNLYFSLGNTGNALIIYSVEHINSKISLNN